MLQKQEEKYILIFYLNTEEIMKKVRETGHNMAKTLKMWKHKEHRRPLSLATNLHNQGTYSRAYDGAIP